MTKASIKKDVMFVEPKDFSPMESTTKTLMDTLEQSSAAHQEEEKN